MSVDDQSEILLKLNKNINYLVHSYKLIKFLFCKLVLELFFNNILLAYIVIIIYLKNNKYIPFFSNITLKYIVFKILNTSLLILNNQKN